VFADTRRVNDEQQAGESRVRTRCTTRPKRGAALLIAVVIFAALLATGPAQPAAAYPGAPYFAPDQAYSGNFPDPSVVYDSVSGRYYAFSTPTGGVYVPVMSSTDLVTWTARSRHGIANDNGQTHDGLPHPAPAGATVYRSGDPRFPYDLWAPGVAKVGTRWVMFYALRVDASGRRCIFYATSPTPDGPFLEPRAFYCSNDTFGSIDPQPFTDTDGTTYLIWKDEGMVNQYGQRLWARRIAMTDSTTVSFVPGTSAALLLESDDDWEAYVAENPSVVRYQGDLLLFYSGNQWNSDGYAVGAATCSTLVGGNSEPRCVRRADNPILTRTVGRKGIGGATALIGAQGQLLLGYHWWNELYAPDYPAFPACQSQPPVRCTENQRRFGIDQIAIVEGRPVVSSTPGPTVAALASRYTPVAPVRVLDTRTGFGTTLARPLERHEVHVTDLAGRVPADATGVILNVTVVDPAMGGFITAYPCGVAPTVSNLNFRPRQTVANLVTVRLSPAREVCVYTYGRSDILVDLEGSYSDNGSGAGFMARTPARLVDTRASAAVAAGGVLEVPVVGRAGVAADATAVTLNVTATDADIAGYLTVWPCAGPPPTASNVNYPAGRPVPNAVTVPLSDRGSVCIFSERRAQVIVDVFGSFGPSGASFLPLDPVRLLDTRSGIGAPAGAVTAGADVAVQITGRGGVPHGATAVVLNLTATDTPTGGYVSAFACSTSPPPGAETSNVNLLVGQTVPNAVTVPLDGEGRMCLRASGPMQLIADVAGSYQ
jgi:hypothetical protein